MSGGLQARQTHRRRWTGFGSLLLLLRSSVGATSRAGAGDDI